MFDKFVDRQASNAALETSHHVQSEIWSRSVAACGKAPTATSCLLLVPALNDMIDITTTRTMATRTHAPTIILVLLVLLSFIGATLVGYTMSLPSRRNPLVMAVFALAIAATVYVVLDLEYPRVGLINLSSMDKAILDLRETMK